eukprot:COSAG02_NODE_15218_length_1193_cov_1.196527_1_plen_244_part_01
MGVGGNDDVLHVLVKNMDALDDLLGEASALSIATEHAVTPMPDPYHTQKPHHTQQLANPPAGTASPWMLGDVTVPDLTAQRQVRSTQCLRCSKDGVVLRSIADWHVGTSQAAEERASAAEARAAAAEAAMQAAEDRAERLEKEAADAVAKAARDAAAVAKRKKRENARSRWKSAGQAGRATALLFGAADQAAEKTAAAEAERAAAEAGVAAMQTNSEWVEPDEKLVALVKGFSRPMEANDVDLH